MKMKTLFIKLAIIVTVAMSIAPLSASNQSTGSGGVSIPGGQTELEYCNGCGIPGEQTELECCVISSPQN